MKKFLVFGFWFLVSGFITAQYNDAGLWTSITAEKKITQSFSAYFNESFRFSENISELGGFFSEMGIEKKFRKNLSFALCYRFANKRELNNSYSPRHRYFFDISYRKKISGFAISYRARIQSQVENYFLPAEKLYGNTPENYWRNKLSLSYNPSKKFKPFVSAEIWYRLSDQKENFIDNIRYSAGIQYDLNKKNSIEMYYIFQKELQQKNPLTDFISALSYAFTF